VCPLFDPIYDYSYSIFWKIKGGPAHRAGRVGPARSLPSVDALEVKLVAARQGPSRPVEALETDRTLGCVFPMHVTPGLSRPRGIPTPGPRCYEPGAPFHKIYILLCFARLAAPEPNPAQVT
jgi:hypothetical protein